jgi:uncharacterized protein (TIGR02680 family)
MDRFVPARGGIVNLWDYRDEEFVFAGGWLVLRGPNGSGKTKALEVLFPFVLDGRIEPRRLNPFASEERTMKSNLLYRGHEAAHAYAWLEFRRGDESVTVGVGMRAHRHTDGVNRWYFVTDGRVGADFALLDAEDRPLTRRQLVEQIGADAIRNTSAEHRAAVDARLFGLGSERFDQLLNLVLTLRRPQLAKNLDPNRLSDTLTDGLRPLDDDLTGRAARSFDDMEAVQRTLEGLVAADEATRAFLGIYSTYLRTHARRAADELTARRDALTGTRAALAQARGGTAGSRAAQLAAGEELTAATGAEQAAAAHLEQLYGSAGYQSHAQIVDLQRVVGELASAAGVAGRGLAQAQQRAERGEGELVEARDEAAQRDTETSRAAAVVAQEASAAGIGWSPADAEPAGFTERVAARATARRDDVTAVRRAAAALAEASRDRDRAGSALAAAEQAAAAAEADEQAAAAAVAQQRVRAGEQLSAWADEHDRLLGVLGAAAVVAHLTAVLDAVGEPGADDPRTAFGRAVAEPTQRVRDELAGHRVHEQRLRTDRSAVEQERRAIAAERDDAPAPFTARTATRDDRPGAPLWRLVRFADTLPDDEAAAVEAALAAANLLDAWVCPDQPATAAALTGGAHDGYLAALPPPSRPSGRTLADVLVAEDQPDVPAAHLDAVLRSVALVPALEDVPAGAPAVSLAGQFGQGVQVGRFGKPHPEYIGATARARRRTARLAECDRRIAELTDQIAEVARQAHAAEALLVSVDAAAAALPAAAPIHAALRDHHTAAVVLRERLGAVDTARTRLDEAVAAAGAAERELVRVVADRSLPADRVDTVAAAVDRFAREADRLTAARRLAAAAHRAVAEASTRREAANDALAEAADAAETARARHAVEAERLRTLQDTLGAEAQQVTAEIDRTQAVLRTAKERLAAAHRAALAAERAAAAAESTEQAAEAAVRAAVAEVQATAHRLAPYAVPDLLAVLRCPPDLRWPAQPADWPEPAVAAADAGSSGLPDPVVGLHEAILAATRDLTPTETSVKQSATRLFRALDDLHEQLAAAGQDYRPEHDAPDSVVVVRVADEAGYAPIGAFATRIAGERQSQEQLLAEHERRILEDALLAQLARQIHDRTVDARDLVARMNADMKARRTSSGLAVGVGWLLADSLDDEQRAVCTLLERDPAALGPDELARLRQHFASRIKMARAARPDRPYRELLADVLDYRRWRRFGFTLHRPGRGGSEPLTRARHSQLSGGEQSVTLHLPLFAAAHALFESAQPTAPRLVALDEAFAGVDEQGRGELLALAVQFGLDLFMTGYDLWAAHPAVPGCAHYDLSHAPAEHVVSAMLLVWDGAENIADLDGSLAAALGSPGTRRLSRQRAATLLDEVPG